MRRFLLFLTAFVLAPLAPAHAAPKEPKPRLAYYEKPHTLSEVAAKFKLSVSEIMRLNGIKNQDRFNRHGLLLPDVPATKKLPRYVPWKPAQPRVTCPVVPWKLVAAKEKGCAEAFCGRGPEGERACLCRDSRGETTIAVHTDDKTLRLPVEISDWNPWDSNLVDIASADLDGDGSLEIMISTLWAVSNGLAESFRELVVLRDGRESFRYDSGEFSADTALVKVGKTCHLASAHWEEVTHPLKGPALHHVERTFDPTTFRVDDKIIGCRAGERACYELPFDPLSPAALPKQSGTLISVSTRDHGAFIRLRTGTKTRTMSDVRFGIAESRHLLPLGFVPATVPQGKAFFGRSKELDVVWLSDASQRN